MATLSQLRHQGGVNELARFHFLRDVNRFEDQVKRQQQAVISKKKVSYLLQVRKHREQKRLTMVTFLCTTACSPKRITFPGAEISTRLLV